MSFSPKNFRLQILLSLMVLAIVIVAGCSMGGGSGDDDYVQPVVSLSGNILMPPGAIASLKLNTVSTSERLLAAKLTGYVSAAGAEVWIEELPDFPHEITDKDGKYEFKRLPPGNYHVISSLKKNDGSIIKVRSAEVVIELKNEKASVPDLGLAPANKVVTGVLLDPQGNFLPPGTLLTLWGEKFYVGEDGKFTSPPLPDDVDTAGITLQTLGTGSSARQTINIQFSSSSEQTTVEIQVGSSDNQPRPFSALLNARKNGQPVSAENVIRATEQVDLSLTLIDFDINTAGVTIVWDSGRGSFLTDPANKDYATWLAPADSGMATISVKLSSPGRGSFKVSLPVVVDIAIKAPTFSVAFATQGGSAVNAQTVESGARAASPAATTRPGYIFSGWYKEAACTNLWDFCAEKITANTTIYAKWISAGVTNYVVTFDSQLGTTVTAQMVESGAKATLPAVPARTSYVFAGWYKEAACTNLWDFASEAVIANTIIYAKWIAVAATTYAVTFDAQGGSAVNAQTVESGARAASPAATTRSGYIFTGWYKEAACTNLWDFSSETVIANTTIYAKWISVAVTNYVVTFDSQLGTTVTAQMVESGAKAALPAVPARTSYVFAGWYKEAACTNLWDFSTETVAANTTIYAKWNETINIAAVPGVTAPVTGATPVTTITATAQYTGTVVWSPAHSPFAAATAYSATITLTPKTGFTLTGVNADFFTVAEATYSNAANSGAVSAAFASTASTTINIAAVPGVTAPVAGETPVMTITETAQYTGTVTWSPAHSTFAAATVYTATVTLSQKTGFTLTGVGADFFTVAGATATNAANSGAVSAEFASTAALTTITIAAIPGVTAPVIGATPVTTITATDQYTGAVSWSPNHSPFNGATEYTATITLTPKAGYTLAGVGTDFFTATGGTATNAANSGVVTVTYPVTAALLVVDQTVFALWGVTQDVPMDWSARVGSQYTATPVSVTYYDGHMDPIYNTPTSFTFVDGGYYVIHFVLTAKPGYTLTGASAFTHFDPARVTISNSSPVPDNVTIGYEVEGF